MYYNMLFLHSITEQSSIRTITVSEQSNSVASYKLQKENQDL